MVNLRDRYGLGALSLYSTLSLLFFGRGLLGHFSERYMGFGPDPSVGINMLAWWPYALAHRLNPLIATTLWAPYGFNLTWSTCVPLVALLVSPITMFFGPVAAYNTIMLACPALAAWTAFLLCRYLTRSYWPSIAGGYTFGFSAYMLGHIISNVHFAAVLFVPLFAYMVLRYLDRSLTSFQFVIYLILLLLGQFLLSLEILAIVTIFGTVALLIGYGIAEEERRDRIRRVMPLLVYAYLATGILMSPYLYYFFFSAFGLPPQMSRGLNELDVIYPLNVCLPTTLNLIGHFYKPQIVWLGSHIYNATGYIGIPMLIVLCHYAYLRRQDPNALFLVLLFLIVCIASFGATFSFGRRLVNLPWAALFHLPLINRAMPSRFTFVSFLCLAIILSLWLNDASVPRSIRAPAAMAVLVFVLPNPLKTAWYTKLDIPAFFSRDLYKQYLLRNDNIVILPYGFNGESTLWQAMTGMYFRMAGVEISAMPVVPPQFQHWNIVYAFYDLGEIPNQDEQLKALLAQNDVSAVIVVDKGRHVWRPLSNPGPVHYLQTGFYGHEKALVRSLLGTLDVTPLEVGGVTLYKVPLARLAAYKNLDPSRLEEQSDAMRLNALLIAANSYFDRGPTIDSRNPNKSFNLHKLGEMGLLPRAWLAGPWIRRGDSVLRAPVENGLFVDAITNDRIVVGVLGSEEVLDRLAGKYRATAMDLAVRPPRQLGNNADSSRWMLAVLYDRRGLSRAAQIAKAEADKSPLRSPKGPVPFSSVSHR